MDFQIFLIVIISMSFGAFMGYALSTEKRVFTKERFDRLEKLMTKILEVMK